MLKTALAATLSITALAALPMAGTAQAGSSVKLGQLTCKSAGGTGLIVVSTKNLTCIFKPADTSVPAETYSGTIQKIGIDIGTTGKTIIQWGVLAQDTAPYQPNSLAGSYSGVGADASFAAGGGANVMVGGTGQSFFLQPLSVQVQEGVNAAVGITTLELEPAAG